MAPGRPRAPLIRIHRGRLYESSGLTCTNSLQAPLRNEDANARPDPWLHKPVLIDRTYLTPGFKVTTVDRRNYRTGRSQPILARVHHRLDDSLSPKAKVSTARLSVSSSEF